MSANRKLARWQGITLATLFTGYAGYYVCRSNLSVATPLLRDAGFTKSEIGQVASLGVLLYAVGKISNGVTSDFLGGRALFLLGMVASVICTMLFGLGSGLAVFFVAWALNRYFQSMGWVALVKTASRWYPVHRHATVMGILSMSFLLGDALVRLYLGWCIELGAGWRGVFFISAATLAAIAVMAMFTLRSSPQDVELEEPAVNPANVFGEAGAAARPESIGRLLVPLVRTPTFWLICVINFGLTLIRETFNQWTPTYLNEATGTKVGEAAIWSLVFPLVGAVSALLAGVVSDRLRGRHGRVMFPCLVLLVGALYLMATSPSSTPLWMAVAMVCAVSFFLLAPYSYLSGVMALDLGGKQGSATTSGLVDSAGYVGAIVSGWGIGAIAENAGWGAAFRFLAYVAAGTAVAALVYLLFHERSAPGSMARDRNSASDA